MSTSTPPVTPGVPPQPTVVQPLSPTAAALEALAHTREASLFMQSAAEKLLAIAERGETPPEMRTVVINPGNTGVYQTLDQSRWEARSIGVYNNTAFPVFIGVGGVSAGPLNRAPVCPANAVLILPILARNLEFGCDPAVLLASTAVIWVFRFLTVQRLFVSPT